MFPTDIFFFLNASMPLKFEGKKMQAGSGGALRIRSTQVEKTLTKAKWNSCRPLPVADSG
jgi:hypothetical protein